MTPKRFEELKRLVSRVDAPLEECLDEIEELTERLRETLKAGDWARGEATEAKGRAVVAEQRLREMTKERDEAVKVKKG